MYRGSKRRNAALVIITLFLILSTIGPRTVEKEKIKNWNNETYWRINPSGVPPDWYGTLKNLPPTEWLRGSFKDGKYVFLYYFHYSASPEDILILTNSTSSLTVKIVTPDKREYTLWEGPVYGIAYPRRLHQTFLKIAEERCNTTVSEGDILLKDAYNVIFSKPKKDCFEHPDFLRGTYKIVVEGAPAFRGDEEIRIRVIGKTYGNLGTDTLGRDVWTGFVWGARDTIITAVLGAAILAGMALLLGTLSTISGWMGAISDFVSKLLTVIPALPTAVILVILASAITPDYTLDISPLTLSLVVGILLMGNTSRNIKAIVEEELRTEYVESARAIGGDALWILKKHVSKVLLPYVVYQFSISVPSLIGFITLLGFFNVTPGLNWGALMSQTLRTYGKYTLAWWQVVPVGTAIGLIALGFIWLTKEIEDQFLGR